VTGAESLSHVRDSLFVRRQFCNLIRFVAATAVLISNSYPIAGEGMDLFLGKIPVAQVVVYFGFADSASSLAVFGGLQPCFTRSPLGTLSSYPP
jgi:hypothetical protein